jgi:beta-lactamase class A
MALQVMHGDGGGDHRVHDAFGDFAALGAPQDGRVGHQVADVAHEHQAAAVQGDGALPSGPV